ncbi:MAG: baseplate assembly protein [Alphaproteobacteria bacterium]
MNSFNVIDLSKLPAPEVVENIDYETLLQEYYSTFIGKDAGYDALLESDPAIMVLQTTAYREMLTRHRINEAAKSSLLAYATGSDLDQKAVGYGVSRLEGEDDNRLRYRCQLSLEGFSTAGPVGGYTFHALSASVRVKSVSVDSPSPGQVLITALSTEGDGTASTREDVTAAEVTLENNVATLDGKNISDLVVKEISGSVTYIEGVDYVFDKDNALLFRTAGSHIPAHAVLSLDYQRADVLELIRLEMSDEDKRPLTDLVSVEGATIAPYTIEAKITVYPGPSFAVVENEGRDILQEYVSERHVVGGLVALSGIHDALHTKGVKKVEITAPTADIVTDKKAAPYCTAINLTTVVDYG